MPPSLNIEFDSRILRTSLGPGGVIRPHQRADFAKAVASGAQCPHCPPPGPIEKLYCINCGKEGTAITADLPPALKGDPGVVWTCDSCEAAMGRMPLPEIATSFVSRR